MKNRIKMGLIVCLAIVLITASVATVAAKNDSPSHDGLGGQNEKDNMMQEQWANWTTAPNTTELQQMIQERKKELEQDNLGREISLMNAYRHQNNVTIAIHAFLLMRGKCGYFGQNITTIAQEFNNSVNKTVWDEDRITARSAFMRFITGGDDYAANEIQNETAKREIWLQELNQTIQQCNWDPQVKAILQGQLQNMEQEHNRLNDLAIRERVDKGIFGWIWKR